MLLSMIGGKVFNVLKETKLYKHCYIRGATPKDMNNLEIIKKKVYNELGYFFRKLVFLSVVLLLS